MGTLFSKLTTNSSKTFQFLKKKKKHGKLTPLPNGDTWIVIAAVPSSTFTEVPSVVPSTSTQHDPFSFLPKERKDVLIETKSITIPPSIQRQSFELFVPRSVSDPLTLFHSASFFHLPSSLVYKKYKNWKINFLTTGPHIQDNNKSRSLLEIFPSRRRKIEIYIFNSTLLYLEQIRISLVLPLLSEEEDECSKEENNEEDILGFPWSNATSFLLENVQKFWSKKL